MCGGSSGVREGLATDRSLSVLFTGNGDWEWGEGQTPCLRASGLSLISCSCYFGILSALVLICFFMAWGLGGNP